MKAANKHKHKVFYALLRLIVFSGLFFAVLVGLDRLFFARNNLHPVWEYVADKEHEPIDILFIGNSHTYTTIDAGLISHATGLNTRSLTCPSINGEIVAADLEAFLSYEVPKIVIVEMCPFTAANFDIMRNESVGLVLEHLDGIPDLQTRWKAVSKVTGLENVPSGVFQLLRNTMMWTRWASIKTPRLGFDEYGTNRVSSVYYNSAYDPDELFSAYSSPVNEDSTGVTPRNQDAFLQIIDLAEKYHFSIWVYNAPIGVYDRYFAEALHYISTQQEAHPCIQYIDNSMLALSEIGIDKTDYFDANHLNSNGMEKTSVWIGQKIAERLHTGFQTDSILSYQDTKITMEENGLYRYIFNTFSPGQYRFVYRINGEQKDTGYMEQNWIEEGAISSAEINDFKVYARPSDDSTADSETVSYPFLPYTVEEYSAVFSDGHSIEIKNKSNFSDDLAFAWDVTDLDTMAVEHYDYSSSNTIRPLFTKSGKYAIQAYTRQLSTDVCHPAEIMTVVYDADKDTLFTEQMMNCVTVE